MPFIGVDSHHHIDLDVLNASNVSWNLPGELLICHPCRAHAQECRMGDCLGVRCNSVVLYSSQTHVSGSEARKDFFNLMEACVRSTVLDEDEWLAFGVDTRAMKGMTRHNINISWQVLL